MKPELLKIGPVSFLSFLIFSIITGIILLIINRIFKKTKPQLVKDIFSFGIFLIIIVFILMITKLSLPIRTYGVMVATGFLTATIVASILAPKRGLPKELFSDLAIVLLISGIIGSRVFYVIFYNWNYYMEHPLEILFIWHGGQVLYGGVIFGAIAAILWLKKKKVSILDTLDLVMIGLLIGIGFGRLGCLSAGCCYGQPYEGFCALHFPPGSIAFDELLSKGLISKDSFLTPGLWPTQLFASLFAFLSSAVLLLIEKPLRKNPGVILSIGLILYSSGRFFEETHRVNPKILLFSSAQWISIFLFITGITLLIIIFTKKINISKTGGEK